MRGPGRAVARKPVPKFPDVRGQVEDIILGNRGANSLWSSHTARNRSDFIYATSAINFNGRSVTGLHLSVSVKGLSVCLNVPHILDRVEACVQVKASKGELKCWKPTI
ncbi:hypothetical protein TNIN_330651 [Trichonephila inaurata madagascariensis]|uniref:Uncharacterized protein n=1 Tax=Trichonephila inaurata madagascariensis TaxID=2747483 RepID=A0A8X7CLM7_9ARAC|nr:hypothetical protein TNIN_330651 [Trichonephila inaurata madagascariensis]